MTVGVVLGIVSGIMLGAFALPMKRIKVWSWEHTWLAFSITALIIMPVAVALATIPDLVNVWKEAGAGVLLSVAAFAAMWGAAAIGYGLAVKLSGIAIANAVVLGLNNAVGSILPIAVFTPGKLLTASGIGVTAGVLVMIVGILACARAGYLRDRSRQSEGSDGIARSESRKGLIICFAAGVLGSSFTFAVISGKPIEKAAIAHGATISAAPNATWPIALASGCLMAIIYCVYLMRKNRNARNYFAAGSAVNWAFAAVMAVLWFGGVMIYGIAATKLGDLGVSVGWAVLQSMTVATGAVLGFLTGEWKSAAPKTIRLLVIGLVCLIAGIVVVVKAGTL